MPIQSLLYQPVAPATTGMLPFEQSFSTYFRLLTGAAEAGAGPVVPIESLAPDADAGMVPIESLLYRGRRALERADLVRRELGAALQTARELAAVEILIAELLDLVPLALDDQR